MKQKLTELKRQIEKSTIRSRHINFLFNSQILQKDVEDLKITINRSNLTDLYRTIYPVTAKFTFFPCAHRALTKIDLVLGHKTNLSTL